MSSTTDRLPFQLMKPCCASCHPMTAATSAFSLSGFIRNWKWSTLKYRRAWSWKSSISMGVPARTYGTDWKKPRMGDGVAQLVERRTQYLMANPIRSTRKMYKFFSKKCADSLSVCPTPMCISTHKNDHVHTLKILWCMSVVGGLQKHEKTQHALYWQKDKCTSVQ